MIKRLRMRKIIIGTISLTLGLLLISCSSSKPKVIINPNETFQKALQAFNKKRWEKASELFNLIVINSPGSELADDAQLYLADCYFNKKEYVQAIAEYQKLIERYPYSPLVEEATYKVALSQLKNAPSYQLDQESTIKALDSFQEFIENYPNSKYRAQAENYIVEIRNRLARKLFETGKLYRKLNEWQAAIYYFDLLFDKYYDTDWVIPAYLEKAYCLIKSRNFEEYKQVYQLLQKRYRSKVSPHQLARLENLYNKELKRFEKESLKGGE